MEAISVTRAALSGKLPGVRTNPLKVVYLALRKKDEAKVLTLYNLPMLEEWLTVHQAADVSGSHFNYIRQMIRARKLEARKFGPVWQVNRTALLEYIEEA